MLNPKVVEQRLPRNELPVTLIEQLASWATIRDIKLREKLELLAKAVVTISRILLS